MSENNKHPSAGRGRKRAGWFRRLFFGGSKTLADDMLETDRYGQQKIEDVEVILRSSRASWRRSTRWSRWSWWW